MIQDDKVRRDSAGEELERVASIDVQCVQRHILHPSTADGRSIGQHVDILLYELRGRGLVPNKLAINLFADDDNFGRPL